MKKFNVTVNGINYEVAVEEIFEGKPAAPAVPAAPAIKPAPVPAPAAAVSAPSVSAPVQITEGETPVNSPMPGKIIKVMAEVGQVVQKGDILLILEAMKMQNEITAPVAGTVKSIQVSAAQNVKPGEVLAVIG